MLTEQGFGAHSAKELFKILKNTRQIISMDLSKNNLSLGLDQFVQGVRENDRIVALKLRNNNIDGRKFQQQLFNLVWGHPSLTALDLGNSDAIKNRNRIYNEGFMALIDGIASCEDHCLISELHLSAASITSEGLSRLSKLDVCNVDIDL